MINIVCCLLFVLFCFLYLYLFQGELMSMAQHIYSHGRTVYYTFLYSFLLTIGFSFVGLALTFYIHVPIRFKALLWFPSFWSLGMLTDVHIPLLGFGSHSSGALPFILAAIIWAVSVFLCKQINENRGENASLSELMWPNMLLLFVGMSFTGMVGNTDRRSHYELRMEELARSEEYEDVLDMSSKDSHPSRCIMYLRAYSLSRMGMLGQRLFQYDGTLGSDCLLPSPTDSLRPANMPAIMRDYLGGFPIHDMNATHFLQYLASDTLAKEPVRDYLLTAFLLDRNLDAFADSLVSFYAPKDSMAQQDNVQKKGNAKKKKKREPEPVKMKDLPRHFAEALLLYSRQTEKPVAVLDDDEFLENYLGFQELYKSKEDEQEREYYCTDYYRGTYWVYYFFGKKE